MPAADEPRHRGRRHRGRAPPPARPPLTPPPSGASGARARRCAGPGLRQAWPPEAPRPPRAASGSGRPSQVLRPVDRAFVPEQRRGPRPAGPPGPRDPAPAAASLRTHSPRSPRRPAPRTGRPGGATRCSLAAPAEHGQRRDEGHVIRVELRLHHRRPMPSPRHARIAHAPPPAHRQTTGPAHPRLRGLQLADGGPPQPRALERLLGDVLGLGDVPGERAAGPRGRRSRRRTRRSPPPCQPRPRHRSPRAPPSPSTVSP